MSGGFPHEWFNPGTPTRVFLYLYPLGTLLGRQAPAADPALFEGDVTTFGRTGNPIVGQRVNSQILDLHRPVLEVVPTGNIPSPAGGVVAQVVADLRYGGEFALPVYSTERSRPGIRVDANFDEVADEESVNAGINREPVPSNVAAYYTPHSIENGRFVYLLPRPSRGLTIQVPGQGLYRMPPTQTILEHLTSRYQDVEVDVEPVQTPFAYIYRTEFVFRPPAGTHRRQWTQLLGPSQVE
jgi:hypothetical protein